MDTLIILVKNPVAGKTKTRLAASVGHPKALKMYHVLMEYTQSQTADLEEVKRMLLYSESVIEGDAWSAEKYHKGVQRGADLGDRMLNAFKDAFDQGAERAVIIGSDCPGVTTALLETALNSLKEKDVVIGPALDGGYYLLGMNALYPSLFEDIAWSTAAVADQTRQQAEKANLSIAELTPLSDVDYLEDWQSYGWPIPE